MDEVTKMAAKAAKVIVVSLKKITQRGTPYQRRPEVQGLIAELVNSTPNTLVERCTNYCDPLPMEALVYLLRNLKQHTKTCTPFSNPDYS